MQTSVRTKKGVVVSNVQDKTIVVKVDRYEMHPKYKKRYLISKKFHVHNPDNKKFELGDNVTFYETTPISKKKKWTIEKPKTKES